MARINTTSSAQSLDLFLKEGDALIIVPPFAQVKYAHLGAHTLQACAREAGFVVRVLYANVLWASEIGCDRYQMFMSYGEVLLGERSFARAAFGTEPWGRNADRTFGKLCGLDTTGKKGLASADITSDVVSKLAGVEEIAPVWADEVARAIAERSYSVVGSTTSVEQTASSVALLKRIKALRPDVTTILGGANCDGPMADQMAVLDPAIDYIFSGECDTLFPQFLKDHFFGNRSAERILRGEPITYMDGLPRPSFDDYFEQYEHYLVKPGLAPPPDMMPYETSRGCWWGQKHHCTFCGINGSGMGFRDKSPARALDDMRHLRDAYGNLQFVMSDAIMPWSFRKTLLPTLAAEDPKFRIAYEEKANLSLKDVILLKSAGVDWMVPGIEALSSGLLKLMKKGVLARQNIALLRYARLCRINVGWSMLLAFPGDQREDYEQTLDLVPMIHHLQPPKGVYPFLTARFSPYFNDPEDYGIAAIRPLDSYGDVFPEHVDLMSFAYNFDADYETVYRRDPELVRRIEEAVERWQQAWESGIRSKVLLRAAAMDGDLVMVRDTRGLEGTDEYLVMDRDKAIDFLTQQPFDAHSETQNWAVRKRLAVIVDDCYVPLATASPGFLLEIEAEAKEKKLDAECGPAPAKPVPDLAFQLSEARPAEAGAHAHGSWGSAIR